MTILSNLLHADVRLNIGNFVEDCAISTGTV